MTQQRDVRGKLIALGRIVKPALLISPGLVGCPISAVTMIGAMISRVAFIEDCGILSPLTNRRGHHGIKSE